MDYLYWLFGFPTSVYALGGHLSNLEIDVEDIADILMRFTEGGQSFPVSLHEDYVQQPASRGCAIIGDAGKILLDFSNLTITVYDNNGNQVEFTNFAGFQRNQMFLDELNNFIKSLNGSKSVLVSLREAANSLRMALAAKDSLATGKVVNIERQRV